MSECETCEGSGRDTEHPAFGESASEFFACEDCDGTGHIPDNEIRRPDGTVLRRWVGEATWGWDVDLIEPFEFWRDGRRVGHIPDTKEEGRDGG